MAVEYFTKTYPAASPAGAMDLAKLTGAFNRRKFGKHRRGKVMIVGASGSIHEGVTVNFAANMPRKMRMHGGPDFDIYGFGDFRKALRKLVKASKQANEEISK